MFADSAFTSLNLRPMKRLAEKTVFLGFVTAWRLAAWPTTRSPVFVNATMDGVVRAPSALGMTTGSPPSMTAIQELVVPKSMPRILLMPMPKLAACLERQVHCYMLIMNFLRNLSDIVASLAYR